MSVQATRIQDPQQAITEAAHHFEGYANRAARPIAMQAAYWITLSQLASTAGLNPAQVDPGLAQRAQTQLQDAARWHSWVSRLQSGTAELVPYQVGAQPIRLAVRARSGGLGWWPIALQVVRYATTAALAAAGYLSVDAWAETKTITATAQKLDAETRQKLAALAQADPSMGPRILEAMKAADAAAQSAGPSWLDRLAQGAGAASVGALSGGTMLLLGWWFLTRKRKR